jgi:hypothetical protein
MSNPIEGIRYDAEPRAGVDEYLTRKITGPRTAYKASLDILLCHMADFHKLMLGIICKKYGLDHDEVLAAVEEDEEYKNMIVNPAVYTMRYLDEEDVAAAAKEINAVSCRQADSAEPTEAKPKKPRRKIKFEVEEEKLPAAETAAGDSAGGMPPADSKMKQVQLTGEAAVTAKTTTGRKVIVKKKAPKPKATEEA